MVLLSRDVCDVEMFTFSPPDKYAWPLSELGSSSNIELHLGVSVLPLDIWSWNIAIVWIPVGVTRRQYLIVVTSCNLRHTCVTISWHDGSWQSQHLRSKQRLHKIPLKYGSKFKFDRICNGMIFTCGHSLFTVKSQRKWFRIEKDIFTWKM